MDNQRNLPANRVIEPKVLYYGTPVILLTSLNEDSSTNISPMSSSWALGKCIVLGVGTGGKAIENLQRHGECVVNVPDPSLWTAVEALAPLTGKYPLPEEKRLMGYRYEKEKFKVSGLTPLSSSVVQPSRIGECPLQIESKVLSIRIPEHTPGIAIVELEAVKVHAHESIVSGMNHINPTVWSPLIYNFRHYFGLGEAMGKNFRADT